MTADDKMDTPGAFEEHFLAAYLVAIERCEEVRLQVPHQQSRHANVAAVGYSPSRRTWVGCDVLDWLDFSWPKGMNPTKVLPKLRERVELFQSYVSLAEALSRRKTIPKLRFVFAGFERLSPRVVTALPGLSGGVSVEGSVPPMSGPLTIEVEALCGEHLQEVARKVATFSLTNDAPGENHFVRTTRLLAEAGWGPK